MKVRWRPDVSEERRIDLVPRAGDWASAGAISEEERARVTEWAARTRKTLPIVARIAAAAAGLILTGAIFGFAAVTHLPFGRWITAIVAIALAELLVRAGRRYRSGIEEALFLAGGVTLVSALPGKGSEDVLLLLAVVFAIAGYRLLNAAISVGAVALALVWLFMKTDDLVATAWVIAAVAALASMMRLRAMRRPWYDRFLAWLVVGGPLLSWALLAFGRGSRRLSMTELTLLAVLAIWLIAAGIFPRLHAPVVGGMLLGAALAFDVGRDLPMAVEWRFMLAGAVTLVAAVVLDRWLRVPRHGVTSKAISRKDDLSLLEAAAVAISLPSTEPQPGEPQREQGGGSFGGAGASGRY
jgi:hypothetical protein